MNVSNDNLPSLASKRPFLNVQQAVTLAEKLFHFKHCDRSAAKEFDSYDDRNFHLNGTLGKTDQACQEFIFKVLNYVDSTNAHLVDAYMAFMLFTKKEGFSCPAPVKSAYNDKYYVTCKLPWKSSIKTAVELDEGSNRPCQQNLTDGIEIYEGRSCLKENECICAIWMVEFVPGKSLHEVPCTARLLNECGQFLARLHRSLKKFSHSGLERPDMIWSIQNALAVKKYTHALKEDYQAKLVEDALSVFSTDVLPKLSSLDKHVIHGDWNEHNVIVSQEANGEYFISGFIDIADAHNSYRVFDVGIAMAYLMMLETTVDISSSEAAGHFLAGYQAVFPISEMELSMLHGVVAARMCQSLVFGAYQYKFLDPDNDYLQFTSNSGWKVFQEYWKIPKETHINAWLSTCSLVGYVE